MTTSQHQVLRARVLKSEEKPKVLRTLTHEKTRNGENDQLSGRSSPIPADAPPSAQHISSARRTIRRRLFPTIAYESRVSHFDPNSEYRDFQGFYVLFWIGLAIMAVTTMLRNIKDTGYPMRVQIWQLFTVKVWQVALADLGMALTTGLSLPLHRVFTSVDDDSVLRWSTGGIWIQTVFQSVWLVFWVLLPFYLEWTWTAQVFLILHTLTLLMKMHSYAFYSGHLSETKRRLKALDNPSTASKAPAYQYPRSPTTKPLASCSIQETYSKAQDSKSSEEEDLEELRETLAIELTSPLGSVTYPKNLTWSNYTDYLFCPTLCYELEYPRVSTIEWDQLFYKVLATFGCIFLLTMTSEEFILPVLTQSAKRLETASTFSETALILIENISLMLFPFMITFLLVFLTIFEYVLNAFAILTHFSDRHFYSDWWNSTDWLEFSREWNIPVHHFFRRHVYSASRPHIGKNWATVVTFLISAVGHELVMAAITKKIRGYGFLCQMSQLPLVAIQKTKWVRERRLLNNVCFWCSMILGLSMICSLYVLC